MNKKLISLLLTFILFSSNVLNCYANGDNSTTIQTEVFVYQELFSQYSLIYDTFDAVIVMEDNTEITGIGYTDYSAYYDATDDSIGYFPAGFIADKGYEIPSTEVEKGLIIENLDFNDDQYQFIYAFETEPFTEHCVKDGQYLKYGVNNKGAMFYETSVYERGVCDESLGALYSYDAGKYVFDPDVGNHVRINGITLFDQIDFEAAKAQMNQIIEDQDINFPYQEIVSSAHISQEAIVSYLLSVQEETILGYRVTDLIEAASQLDPMQCIRITPEGFMTVDITDDTPATADELTKWLVGAGCFILVVGSIALDIFVPAARPLSGAIMGAAIDAFVQVVIENKSLENVQWEKVAVAAVSGAMMAWACPMAAASITKVATKAAINAGIKAGASEALGKLAGYGMLTFCNGMVAGTTNMALSVIDAKDDGWNAFLYGAIIGAAGTVISSAVAEVVTAPKIAQILSQKKPVQWLNKTSGKVDLFIREHQVHITNKLEDILAPKSVHMAAKNAIREMYGQTGAVGGSFREINTPGDGTKDRHEVVSFSANNKAQGIESGKRSDLPSVLMDKADHRMTASWGNSTESQAFIARQENLIKNGEFHQALQMGIDDLHTKFGTKYNEAIEQMLDYARIIGWW